MNSHEYSQFILNLGASLVQYPQVIGLVAVGSMAAAEGISSEAPSGGSHCPDEWSDHDFFVIVQRGFQEEFRTDLSWLPRNEEIVFSFRETEHGVKVFYSFPHLLEFAVFDLDEFYMAKINQYLVIFDRGGVEETSEQIQDATLGWSSDSIPSDEYLVGQMLCNIFVGLGRHFRGEILSAHEQIKIHAMKHLVRLIQKHVPSPQLDVLDNIDPLRRSEDAYPSLGEEIRLLLCLQNDDAAMEILRLFQEELESRLAGFPRKAVEAIVEFKRKQA